MQIEQEEKNLEVIELDLSVYHNFFQYNLRIIQKIYRLFISNIKYLIRLLRIYYESIIIECYVICYNIFKIINKNYLPTGSLIDNLEDFLFGESANGCCSDPLLF